MQIIKSVTNKPDSQVEMTSYTTSSVGYKRLVPYIADAIGLKPTEVIEGFRIDENGITALIGKKETK